MLMEADLPNDVEALRALVLEQARELDALKVFQAEVERLKAIIDALQRHRFGRRSEQLDLNQFELALEEVETALAEAEPPSVRRRRASRRASRRGAARGENVIWNSFQIEGFSRDTHLELLECFLF